MRGFFIVNKAGEFLTCHNLLEGKFTFTKNRERAYCYDTIDQALPISSLFEGTEIKEEFF